MKKIILTIVITISLTSTGLSYNNFHQVNGMSNNSFPPPVMQLD